MGKMKILFNMIEQGEEVRIDGSNWATNSSKHWKWMPEIVSQIKSGWIEFGMRNTIVKYNKLPLCL